MKFEPELAEYMRTGATAALILDGQKRLSDECVAEVLRKIDAKMANGLMTPDLAVQFVSEIAAYRRIVYRQEQKIKIGEAAQRRLAEDGQ